jgi:hypothetical protein
LEAHPPADYYPPLRPRRWPWMVALVAVLLAAAAGAFLLLRDDDGTETVRGPEGDPFTVEIPAGWESAPPEELTDTRGSPVAVLRQVDGSGLVTISPEPSIEVSLPELSQELEAELSERFPDFELASSRTVTIEAGSALSISYARTEDGTSHTLVAVPAGEGSYAINAVVPAGEDEAAAEVGGIIASFDLE